MAAHAIANACRGKDRKTPAQEVVAQKAAAAELGALCDSSPMTDDDGWKWAITRRFKDCQNEFSFVLSAIRQFHLQRQTYDLLVERGVEHRIHPSRARRR